MALRLQVRHRGGQERLTVEPNTTLGSLVDQLSSKATIAPQRLKIRYGYPPKLLSGGDPTAAVSSLFPSGECLILEEGDEPSVAVAAPALPAEVAAADGTAQGAAPAPAVQRPMAPVAAPPVNSSGVGVRRVVDADNSCLFTSLAYVLLGKDRSAGLPLRAKVAAEILSDPSTWSEAVLAMEPSAYAAWIKEKKNWGGAIELAIMSEHFSTVIVAWDIQTLRSDRYGEGKGYLQCVHLVYDGLHYDALALSILEDVPPESEDFDVTIFHPDDSFMEKQAKAVVSKLQAAKLFTDTQSFTLRCLVCQKGLVGESDAVEHAKATGHQNFAEYK